VARVEPITVPELYTQLVSFEQRVEMQGGGAPSSANMVMKNGRGRGNTNNSPRNGRGGGGRGGFGRGHKGDRGGTGGGRGGFQSGVFCQLCGKEGHTVVCYFKRLDTSYTGP